MVELNSLQKKVLTLLAKSSLSKRFYWTGGTLLASHYLHHRLSEDLDFFTDQKFSYNDVIGFINELQKFVDLDIVDEKRVHDRWEFLIRNKERLRLEFVFYDFPKLKTRKQWQGVLVDSLDDLIANKVMALFDRAHPKDLFDVYCLLTRRKYSVNYLLKKVEQKFKVRISESALWGAAEKALRNLSTIEPFLLVKNQRAKEKLFAEVKDYFISHSVNYLHRVLK